MPTNSLELIPDILEGGTADSNCLDRLMEVSEALIELHYKAAYGKANWKYIRKMT